MAVVTDQLYGYWNSKQGVSGNSWSNIALSRVLINGAITGATAQANGMTFDGVDDRVVFTFPTGEETYFKSGSNSWSFELFLKITNPDTYPDILAVDTNTTIYVDNTDNLYVTFLGEMFFPTVVGYILVPTSSLAHFAVTYNGSTREMKLYSNGQLKRAETSASATILISGNSFTIGSNDSYPPKGIIDGIKLYKKVLSQSEITQNYNNGLSVGYGEEPQPSSPPAVTIISVDKTKISDEIGMNKAIVKFKFDKDIVEYTVRVGGTSQTSGVNAQSAVTNISANTEITAEIDNTELAQEGNNRINIYGKDANGVWTQYNS